jgi:uncharacterized protein (TIGR01777 family)
MKILIAGGTGFLGSALRRELRRAGHDLRVLTRRARPDALDAVEWLPDGTVGAWARAIDDADVVVNLAGVSLADARWTEARKKTLRDSRILSTRSLVLAVQQARRPPAVFVSVSGTGYYGDRGSQLVTEDTPAGDDFLARLCVDWEREAEYASDVTRVVILRNGAVLDPSGGALKKMLLPFRLGLGGPLGSGTQYFPWIHLEDWTALAMALITNNNTRGVFNATAPTPTTNGAFTRAFGHALGRPTILPVPAFGLRTVFGELAEMLLTGQRAIPQRAERLGFTFRFREIEPALRDLLTYGPQRHRGHRE